MRQQTLLALVLGLLAAVTPAGTADTAGSYRLRSEDVIQITVLGIPQLDQTVTILPDGTISYPRLGTVPAAGKTAQQLKTYLFERLNRFYNNPEVSVSVKSLRTDRVTVSGAVKNPAIYDMRPGWTVRELLAAAGGLATANGPPAPDQMRATLFRRTGQRISLKLAQLLGDPNAPDVPGLEPDDVLSVEDLTIYVWVTGQVNSPDKMVPLSPGGTVVDALRQAGGPTKDAALTKASIRRGAEMIAVNLRPFFSESGALSPPPVLQRYDTLIIPENKERVFVWGGVQNPGFKAIPEGEVLYLRDAISLAGGPVPRARLSQVSLVQQVDGKAVHTPVNVEKMLKGDLKQNVALRSGDMIYVPDPKQPRNSNPLAILQGALLLFGL